MITVVLADDHAVLRDALRYLLEAAGDIQVVATAGDGRQAVEETTFHQPDIVVMDTSLPTMNSIDATRQILRLSPQTQVLMLSMHPTSDHVQRALEAGASGYLLKDSAGVELVSAIRAVYKGEKYLGQRVKQAYDSLSGDGTTDAPPPGSKKKKKGK